MFTCISNLKNKEKKSYKWHSLWLIISPIIVPVVTNRCIIFVCPDKSTIYLKKAYVKKTILYPIKWFLPWLWFQDIFKCKIKGKWLCLILTSRIPSHVSESASIAMAKLRTLALVSESSMIGRSAPKDWHFSLALKKSKCLLSSLSRTYAGNVMLSYEY